MFVNRREAGEELAKHLLRFKGASETVVYAIPRGGVVVGKAVADALRLPLDVVVVKKLGAPDNPELAIGAVCNDGTTVRDESILAKLAISPSYWKKEKTTKIKQAKQRYTQLKEYSLTKTIPVKNIILVDDGIATGATAEVAIRCLKKHGALSIILAVPVCSRDTIQRLIPFVDDAVVLETPESFAAVGQFYTSFDQVTDEEVRQLLASRA